MVTTWKTDWCIILISVAVFPLSILSAQSEDIVRKPGMNIYGWVSNKNVGLPGVVVSDGFEVTATDANGVYYLPSEKRHGYVFITIPGNFFPPVADNIPQFFQRLKADANTAERVDFELTPVDNDKHVILVFGDTHFDNGNAVGSPIYVPNIMEQFEHCLADMNDAIDSYHAAGTKTYLLTVGDMTRESRWFLSDRPFGLREYADVLKRFNTVSFNTKGNHDNDPYGEGDWAGEQAWKDIMGPTYYSFNLGRAHYVVLDNIVWNNKGASEGVMGDRSYTSALTDHQIEWLKKDLAMVADKSAPLIIAMHVPLYSRPNADNRAGFAYMIAGQGQQLVDCLVGFTNVLVLAGHTHPNSRYSPPEHPWLTSHHIASLSGNCWMTGQPGWASNHICKDGSPGGYGVYTLDGKNMKWYYKGVGFDRHYQFRTYDCNTIHITAEKYASNANTAHLALVPTYAVPYNTPNTANEVIINVWGWEASWQIEVKEGSELLPITRISTKDPLSIISYDFQAINSNRQACLSESALTASHFFKVTAQSATSTLDIKVTDQFGNVYTETMTRPKNLTFEMK